MLKLLICNFILLNGLIGLAVAQDRPARTPEECVNGNGVDYRGTLSVTNDGRVCKNWEDFVSIGGPFGVPTLIEEEGNHNYCRNPDNDGQGAWCYVDGDREGSINYCDIPQCSNETATEASRPRPTTTTTKAATTTTTEASTTTESTTIEQEVAVEVCPEVECTVESLGCWNQQLAMDERGCHVCECGPEPVFRCGNYDQTNRCEVRQQQFCKYFQWRITFATWMKQFMSYRARHGMDHLPQPDCVITENMIECANEGQKVCYSTPLEDCPICYCMDHQYQNESEMWRYREQDSEYWSQIHAVWMQSATNSMTENQSECI